jgi:hypothetical protein
MKLSLQVVLLALLPVGLDAQEVKPPDIEVRSWSYGDRGPLPVRVQFYTNRVGNVLDSLSVFDAVFEAMKGAHLPPDVQVFWMNRVFSDRRHLYLEIDVYSEGEVRYERIMREADGERGAPAIVKPNWLRAGARSLWPFVLV